jgi:endoglucanase
VGFTPQAQQKFAYLSAWLGDKGALTNHRWAQKSFHLVDTASGKIVFSGRPTLRRRLSDGAEGGQTDETVPYAGTDTWQCDFSTFRKPGKYVLTVDGIGCSFAFRIHGDVYRDAFITTLRGLYHQRCGVAREAKHTRWTRAACHRPETAHYWQVKQRGIDKTFGDGFGRRTASSRPGRSARYGAVA